MSFPFKSLYQHPAVRSVAAALSMSAFVSVIAACSDAQSTPAPPPAPGVTVADTVSRPVTDWDAYSGRVEAVEQVDLRPRVSGTIDTVAFNEGSIVKQGDLLFRIDPRPFEAALAGAEADLARARAQLDLARSEKARSDRLLAARAISREEYDQRVSADTQSRATLAAAQAAVEAARLDVEFTRVTAPIDGRVSRADVTAGNFVSAGQTRLTTLVSVDPIYVSFDGDERSYLRYAARPGAQGASADAVEVGLADEDGFPHRGTLDFVDNALDPRTGTMHFRVRVPNPDGRLTPGLYARVRLAANAPAAATLVDQRAVITDQDRKAVFVVGEDDTISYRPVTLGAAEGELRVVREGLQPGERVIVEGLTRVRPGMQVTPTEAPVETAAAH